MFLTAQAVHENSNTSNIAKDIENMAKEFKDNGDDFLVKYPSYPNRDAAADDESDSRTESDFTDDETGTQLVTEPRGNSLPALVDGDEGPDGETGFEQGSDENKSHSSARRRTILATQPNASASGDLSVHAMKLLTMQNMMNQQAPLSNAELNRTDSWTNRNGKRTRPYGSPDSFETRKRMKFNHGGLVRGEGTSYTLSLFKQLGSIRTSLRTKAQRQNWIDRCEYIKKRMQESFRTVDMIELKSKVGQPLKGGWGAIARGGWRTDLQVGDEVDLLTLKLRWVRGEIIGTDPDQLYVKQLNDLEVTPVNRRSVRVAPAKTHTLTASDQCDEAKVRFGVWDTRCLRAQTWRLPLRAGSELDILWKNGNWYNGVVREVLDGGANLRIEPLPTAQGSTSESVVVYRGSCRIVPYKMMASGGWMEDSCAMHDEDEDDVRSSSLDREDFLALEPKQLKMRMLNIAESVSPALVIIDWDDTLFPTTHVMSKEVPSPAPQQWAELSAAVSKLLTHHVMKVGSGNVIIVTNAGSDWVELSKNTFMPGLSSVMEHCQMLSAREGYASRFQHTQWKRHAFCQKLEEMWGMEVDLTPDPVRYQRTESSMVPYWPDQWTNEHRRGLADNASVGPGDSEQTVTNTSASTLDTSNAASVWWNDNSSIQSFTNTELSEYSAAETTSQQKQLISIGDSFLERQAAIEFGSKIPNCWVKSIKLDITPACERLTQEITDIVQYQSEILHYKGSLDLDVSHLYIDDEDFDENL